RYECPLLADNEIYPEPPINQWNYKNKSDSDRVEEWGFGSAHSGITNSLWGDGSVRTIRNSINNNALSSSNFGLLFMLTVRDDGNSVDPNSY
ncbi:MAG TPA: H-X9-DG-CTERM domain-containing protein, partial [Pirellulales bacterium]